MHKTSVHNANYFKQSLMTHWSISQKNVKIKLLSVYEEAKDIFRYNRPTSATSANFWTKGHPL